jgi:flavodoxin
MRTVVVYDSKFGNTERIADAIARGASTLGSVVVMDTAEAAGIGKQPAERPDLVLIGGPTQRRSASSALRAIVDALPASLRGVPVATFDTRYRGSTWIMGSAAAEAAKVLRKAGLELVAPPESFFIGRGGPVERQTLEAGEIERAEAWGRGVGNSVRASATASESQGARQP